MARTKFGKASQELYNEQLTELFKITETIPKTPTDTTVGPACSTNGALWLNRKDNGEFKYFENGEWKDIFYERFRIFCEMLSKERPVNPVKGQLWFRDGVLMYYTGSNWSIAKALNVANDYTMTSFEDFIMISPLTQNGKMVVDASNNKISKIKKAYLEEIFMSANNNINKKYNLTAGAYEPNTGCIEIYINGSKLPRTCYEESSSTSFIIKSTYGYEGTDAKGKSVILAEFINKDAELYNDNEDTTLTPNELYAQFLVPNEYMDKIFASGSYMNNYNKLSDVAIEYPYGSLQGKTVSAIHVNPSNLIGIEKHLFSTTSKNIPVETKNTEFYGVIDGIGYLLVKGANYKEENGGIKLTDSAAMEFDLVCSVTYIFQESKKVGSLEKETFALNGKTSVFLGDIDDDFLVFIQGLYVDPLDNYTFNNGFLIIENCKGLDLGVIAFPNKERGTITEITNGKGKITLQKDYSDRIAVIVYGLNLNSSLAEFEKDETDDKILWVKNANENMKYCVVDLSPDVLNTDWINASNDFTPNEYISNRNIRYKVIDDMCYVEMEFDCSKTADVWDIRICNSVPPKKDTSDMQWNFQGKREGVRMYSWYPKETVALSKAVEGHYSIKYSYKIDAKNWSKYSQYEDLDTIKGSMFVAEGQTKEEDSVVYIDGANLRADEDIILFVNGILVNKYDITIDADENKIFVNGIKVGQDYLLLKDINNRFLFSNNIGFNTVITNNTFNDVEVFIGDGFAIDPSIYEMTELPTNALVGEMVSLVTANGSSWYRYDGESWNKVTDASKTIRYDKINGFYYFTDRTINILKNFNGRNLTYYAYSFANNIEKPLEINTIPYLPSQVVYTTSKDFGKDKNSLSVFVNGKIVNHTELSNNSFRIDNVQNGKEITYIIEEPESGENISCRRCVIGASAITNVVQKIYQTPISLNPGFISVYADGIRLTTEQFTVIDSKHIMISVPTINNNSEIIIEVREDFNLDECIMPIRYNGQVEFSAKKKNNKNIMMGGDGLPKYVLNSNDKLMIFANGILYTGEYTIDKNSEKLILSKDPFRDNYSSSDKIVIIYR